MRLKLPYIDQVILAHLIALALMSASATGPQKTRNFGSRPSLARELIERARVDQAVRIKLLAQKDAAQQAIATKEMTKIDAADIKWMHHVVETYGWPSRKMVGVIAAGDAWLLVQHADQDKPFQRKCLALILPLMDTGEVERSQAALLIDRVLVGEGKSQWKLGPDGEFIPSPIADIATVDIRRKAMNLQPLAEYGNELKKMYANLAPKKQKG